MEVDGNWIDTWLRIMPKLDHTPWEVINLFHEIQRRGKMTGEVTITVIWKEEVD